jgi:hypothetical protein
MSRVFPLRTIGKQWYTLEHRITEYLGRSLTYDSDILDAFKGILAAHERRFSASTRILAGLPISVDLPSGTPVERAQGCLDALGEGMSWFFYDNKDSCILKLQRRSGFPSWTWLGWTQLEHLPIKLGFYDAGLLGSAIVEYANGEKIGWYNDWCGKEIFDRGWAGSIPRFLRITGRILEVTVSLEGEVTDENGLPCPQYDTENSPRRSWQAIASWIWRHYYETSPFPIPFTLLLLGHGPENHVHLLVLHKPPGWDYYQRVDIVSHRWETFARELKRDGRSAAKGWAVKEVRIGVINGSLGRKMNADRALQVQRTQKSGP